MERGTFCLLPISNLSVTSKILERIVVKQLLNHLDTSQLLPLLQSAYRSKHSTETDLVKVLSDILLAIDAGDLAPLVTMLSYYDDLKHLGSEEPLYTGSSRTWSADGSIFVLQSRFHLQPSSSAVYHRALFLAPSSFSYTSPICSCCKSAMVCVCITSQTTLKI